MIKAIITELNAEAAAEVGEMWQKLYEACGLKAIYTIPVPHFTWFAADELDVAEAKTILTRIAAHQRSLTIHTFGLGIFAGNLPVIYLPMVKSLPMYTLHKEIWEEIQPHSKNPRLYYSPKLWLPHITLALKDLTHENLSCAVDALAFDPVEMYIVADNLAIVEHEDEKVGKTLETFLFNDNRGRQ